MTTTDATTAAGRATGPGAAPAADLTALDRLCRELARDLREPGAALDRDPDAIDGYLDLPAVAVQRRVLVPPAYLDDVSDVDPVLRAAASGASCAAWTLFAERLAYGDPGMVLASPGPSLSGAAVRALADDTQRDWFYTRLATRPTWTFFGLTEPGKGSAATELQTTLTPAPDGDGWLLDGTKAYIGNGARAQVGVVFCRRAPGPWGIEAVLVDTADPGFSGELLPTVGLRGARISLLRFDRMRIAPDRLLGRHLPPSRRGLHGARQTLQWFRPSVAALALGLAQAAGDHVRTNRPGLAGAGRWHLDALLDRVAAVRRLVYEVASEVDRGAANVYRISAVKMRAARLAEAATRLAAELLGPASLIEDPWLEKAYRDARAFEFMEGTANIHRLAVFQGLLRGEFFPPGTDGRPR